MKVLVCGGRNFHDYDLMSSVLSSYPIKRIVAGGCSGADKLAIQYALERWVLHYEYPADWKTHGKKAGPIRNSLMITENADIDLVIAFPGGRGTADMVKKAKAAGIKVIEIAKDEGGVE